MAYWQPDQIIDLRKSAGYTQAEFANVIDVQTSRYRQWEDGTTVPSNDAQKLLWLLYIIFTYDNPARLFIRNPHMTKPPTLLEIGQTQRGKRRV